MKIALVITGDVRDCLANQYLADHYKDFDVFCSTYIKHKEYVKTIGKTNHSIFIDPDNEIRLPGGLPKEKMQQNMLQWLHLDNILKNFKEQLLEYDVIIKLRFDTIINNYKPEIIKNLQVKNNVLYNHSDVVFYATTPTFFKAFWDFYDNIPLSYDTSFTNHNFVNSWKSEKMFLKNIHDKKITFLKNMSFTVKLARGKYKKVVGDGNQPLYEKDKIKGKFS